MTIDVDTAVGHEQADCPGLNPGRALRRPRWPRTWSAAAASGHQTAPHAQDCAAVASAVLADAQAKRAPNARADHHAAPVPDARVSLRAQLTLDPITAPHPGPTPELTDAPQPRPCPTPEPAIAPHPCPTLEPTSRALDTVGAPTYVPTPVASFGPIGPSGWPS